MHRAPGWPPRCAIGISPESVPRHDLPRPGTVNGLELIGLAPGLAWPVVRLIQAAVMPGDQKNDRANMTRSEK
jgi:hypothetical protein